MDVVVGLDAQHFSVGGISNTDIVIRKTLVRICTTK